MLGHEFLQPLLILLKEICLFEFFCGHVFHLVNKLLILSALHVDLLDKLLKFTLCGVLLLFKDYLHLQRDGPSFVHLHVCQKIESLLLKFFELVLLLDDPFLVLFVLLPQFLQLLFLRHPLFCLIVCLDFLDPLELSK